MLNHHEVGEEVIGNEDALVGEVEVVSCQDHKPLVYVWTGHAETVSEICGAELLLELIQVEPLVGTERGHHRLVVAHVEVE